MHTVQPTYVTCDKGTQYYLFTVNKQSIKESLKFHLWEITNHHYYITLITLGDHVYYLAASALEKTSHPGSYRREGLEHNITNSILQSTKQSVTHSLPSRSLWKDSVSCHTKSS